MSEKKIFTLFRLYKAPSYKKTKKWFVVVPTKTGRRRTVYFGARGYMDYTQHHDKLRRYRYRLRHQRDKIHDPTKSGFWAWRVLWGPSTNIQINLKKAITHAKKMLK